MTEEGQNGPVVAMGERGDSCTAFVSVYIPTIFYDDDVLVDWPGKEKMMSSPPPPLSCLYPRVGRQLCVAIAMDFVSKASRIRIPHVALVAFQH